MQSFHNDPKVKAKYLKRVRYHQKFDNLIRGEGWNGTRGCAVGCTLEAYDHNRYETELGIPEWLARVEDTLFEGVSLKKSKTWPSVFLAAIPLGVDLEPVKTPFIVLVLEHSLKSLAKVKFSKKAFPDVDKAVKQSKAAVKEMIHCLRGDLNTAAAWSAARSAAWSAAESAWSAARSAAWSAAESARSAESAESAAWSAAESAESAAWSAAESAARSAWSAAESAAESAESAAYDYYANELLKLLRKAE